MSFPVAISGMGSVTGNGIGPEMLWNSVIEEKSGVTAGLGRVSESSVRGLKDLHPEAASHSPAVLFAYAASKQAMKQAHWGSLNDTDGLILATTTGQISSWEDSLIAFLKNSDHAEPFQHSFRHQALGLTLNNLGELLNFKGHSLLLTSACSAATQAIALATLWIQSGKVKRCLVGGSEVLSTLTVEGFKSLQLLSETPSTPFDLHRSGINLSEGSAFLCFEKQSDQPLAYLSGYGFSTDAYHLASPHPEGKGSFRAMSAALKTAKLDPSQVSWVHAHGTGSKANDQAEGIAIQQLFNPDKTLNTETPWVSSTKNIHGHALGASGAIEAVLCVQSLQNCLIPNTTGLLTPDPNIQVKHPPSMIKGAYRHLIKNTLGFGGNNASFVMSNAQEWGRA